MSTIVDTGVVVPGNAVLRKIIDAELENVGNDYYALARLVIAGLDSDQRDTLLERLLRDRLRDLGGKLTTSSLKAVEADVKAEVEAAAERLPIEGNPSPRPTYPSRWEKVRDTERERLLLDRPVNIAPGLVMSLGECNRTHLVMWREKLKKNVAGQLRTIALVEQLIQICPDDQTPLSVLGEDRVRKALSS